MVIDKSGSEQASKKPEKLLVSGVPTSVGKKTQFKKGVSGNPAGRTKGSKNLSVHIRELLEDPEFEIYLPHARDGFELYRGAPVKAIIKAQVIKASLGDTKAFDVLAKYGYGTKIEITGEDGAPLMPIALDASILNRLTQSGATPSVSKTNSSK